MTNPITSPVRKLMDLATNFRPCLLRQQRRPLRSVTALLLGLGAALSVSSFAQGYPEKDRTYKIVVPGGPASAIDLLARAYSKALGDVAGLNFVVDNRAGAEGVMGVTTALTAPADGYTMLFSSSSMVVLNPVMLPKITTYDPIKDMAPLMTISKADLILSLGSSINIKSAREFVVAAKKSPGKYTCATASTTSRMSCEYFQRSAGIELLTVNYKTTAAAVLAVASGEVDTMIVDAGSFLSGWSTGRMWPVAIAADKRDPEMPEVPTMAEEGIPNFKMGAWYGVFFKAGTPPEKVAAMREIFLKASQAPVVKTALKNFLHKPYILTGKEAAVMHKGEIDHWMKFVREQKIQFSN